MNKRFRPRPPRRPRRGLTIIEVLVAILLLGVGLLGLAGYTVASSKQYRGATLQQRAALVVQSRFDSLTSIQCTLLAPGGPQSGSATNMGVNERWSVVDGNDIKVITDTVRFAGRTIPLAYRSIIPCRD
jgi:prepilin-type N-terminal cleavage/methylation domain-containing protein